MVGEGEGGCGGMMCMLKDKNQENKSNENRLYGLNFLPI